ncbi:MAG TPA: SIR2 family protein [Gaiellaceae bacterium]
MTSVAHEGHAADESEREGGTPGRYLANEPIRAAIERIASHPGPITMIVGAGASMEAELPSWAELIRRMLDEAAPHVVDPESTSEWLEAVIDEGLLAAAAVVKALAPSADDFEKRLRGALYGGRTATSFQPQALARQIAWFKQRLGSEAKIVTANYDALLEQALRDRGMRTHSFVRPLREPPGAAAVYHLHGRLAPSYPATGRLVLAEDDYAQIQWPGSWQERFMGYALESTLCVFVGLSLTDPNLIRWLYRYSDNLIPFGTSRSSCARPRLTSEPPCARDSSGRRTNAGAAVVSTSFGPTSSARARSSSTRPPCTGRLRGRRPSPSARNIVSTRFAPPGCRATQPTFEARRKR